MDKLAYDSTDGFFYSALFNVLIRTEAFKSLFEPFLSICDCPAYKLAVQGFNDKIILAEFLKSISPPGPDVRWLLNKLLEINHDCVTHRSLSCDKVCIFHSNFIFKSTSIFNCPSGHNFSNITEESEHPIFEIPANVYFPQIPPVLQHPANPSSSLICPYSKKLITLYSQTPLSKCKPPCQSPCSQIIIPENNPKTLIFLIKYPKVWNEIENLRLYSSFPKTFNSNELFESDNSKDYSISGLLLEDNGKFSSISFSSITKKWILFEDGQDTTESFFECILRSVLRSYRIVSVFYSVGLAPSLEPNDHMWLYMENKIINKYTLNGQVEGVRKSAWKARYWTCVKCKIINYDVKVCGCMGMFSLPQLGWTCSCLKRNALGSCRCGVSVRKCFICLKKYTKVGAGRAYGSCSWCKEWKCTMCYRENSSKSAICLSCFNPFLELALFLKVLPKII